MNYTHGEAFMLMQYECEKCKNIETIWNSRDGITPFMVDCLLCDGWAKHINWQQDVRDPNHKPEPGTRIFVDLTDEAARRYSEEQVDQGWDYKDYPISAMFKTKQEAVECFTKERLKQPGEPNLITVLPKKDHP